MSRDLAQAERHSYSFICEMWNFITHLPDYRMGESADIEEIEFFTDSEEER